VKKQFIVGTQREGIRARRDTKPPSAVDKCQELVKGLMSFLFKGVEEFNATISWDEGGGVVVIFGGTAQWKDWGGGGTWSL